MDSYQLTQTKIALLKSDSAIEESAFKAAGINAWSSSDPESLYKRLLIDPIDILIIDLDQANFDCFNVIQSLYSLQKLPIITLSNPSNTINQIMAISSGADRNLTKPFDIHVLLSNVLAINRSRNKEKIIKKTNVHNDTWLLNTRKWTLSSPDGEILQLTMREMLLIQILVNNKGEFLKKNELEKLIFKPDTFRRKPSMDRLLNQIRSKALKTFQTEFPLKTTYSIGYAFTSPCEII